MHPAAGLSSHAEENVTGQRIKNPPPRATSETWGTTDGSHHPAARVLITYGALAQIIHDSSSPFDETQGSAHNRATQSPRRQATQTLSET